MSIEKSILGLTFGVVALAWGGAIQAAPVTVISDGFDTHADGSRAYVVTDVYFARTQIVDDATASSIGLLDAVMLGRFQYDLDMSVAGSGSDSVACFNGVSVISGALLSRRRC